MNPLSANGTCSDQRNPSFLGTVFNGVVPDPLAHHNVLLNLKAIDHLAFSQGEEIQDMTLSGGNGQWRSIALLHPLAQLPVDRRMTFFHQAITVNGEGQFHDHTPTDNVMIDGNHVCKATHMQRRLPKPYVFTEELGITHLRNPLSAVGLAKISMSCAVNPLNLC